MSVENGVQSPASRLTGEGMRSAQEEIKQSYSSMIEGWER